MIFFNFKNIFSILFTKLGKYLDNDDILNKLTRKYSYNFKVMKCFVCGSFRFF